jgi:hypothetical protein
MSRGVLWLDDIAVQIVICEVRSPGRPPFPARMKAALLRPDDGNLYAVLALILVGEDLWQWPYRGKKG